jgi:hypothetical protein
MPLPRLSSSMLHRVVALWKTIVVLLLSPSFRRSSCVFGIDLSIHRQDRLAFRENNIGLRFDSSFSFVRVVVIGFGRVPLLHSQYRLVFSLPSIHSDTLRCALKVLRIDAAQVGDTTHNEPYHHRP